MLRRLTIAAIAAVLAFAGWTPGAYAAPMQNEAAGLAGYARYAALWETPQPCLDRGMVFDAVFVGTPGNDTIYGTLGRDLILGLAGEDTLNGAPEGHTGPGDQADCISGGANGDLIKGDHGDDVLIGDGWIDWIEGSYGSDLIIGGAGKDTAHGGSQVTDIDVDECDTEAIDWEYDYDGSGNKVEKEIEFGGEEWYTPDCEVYK